MTAIAPREQHQPVPWTARLLGRWRDLRNRLVGDPGFQRFAAAFPLTRPVARREAAALFDLCAGFVYSQVLFACVRLRLLDHVAAGPLPPDDLSRRLGLAPAAGLRLVRAAAALGLVEWRGGHVGLGMRGAALRGNPGALAMIEHHGMLYRDLADPVALLRGEADPAQLSRFWAYAGATDAGATADAAAYTALMAASQSLIAEDILDAYPVSGHRVILDIGGGDGTFLGAVHRRAPDARLMLFDLPAVAALAAAKADRPDSLTIHPGSFREEELPGGADLITLIRVAHDHDDHVVRPLLGRIRRALAPGGTLMIAEPMAQSAAVAPMADAYFGLYLMAMGSGQARSPQTLEAMLRDSGFDDIRHHRTRRPLFTGLMTARRPKET
ncbi:methyltransferase [Phreatobacter sp.]|uniref:methyltransferase n=1 Tax=Phreatobacter sp. TaxID=1966341 RepID=UPI0025DFD0B6|nr:methyltransferase [Phreatobacter sp.]